jgi:hypothetical protein
VVAAGGTLIGFPAPEFFCSTTVVGQRTHMFPMLHAMTACLSHIFHFLVGNYPSSFIIELLSKENTELRAF